MSSRRLLRWTAFAGGILLILPPPARAQTVRGKVVEDSVLLPVPGAFVTLRDTAGLVVAGSLTDSSGTFQLTGKAGKYTLHVERLGYRSFSTAVFRLDTTQVRELRVSSAPVALPSLSIEARRKCKPANALGPEEILIWEELRKSLAVADWTATESGITYDIREYDLWRGLDNLDVVERLNEKRYTVRTNHNPMATISPDSMLKRGFIIPVKDAASWQATDKYFAPDARLLLSSAFQETHCFAIETDAARPGMVGFAFEGTGAIKPYDVEGVLWLDRSTHELRRLEFGYNRLPHSIPRNRIRGAVEFVRLPSGRWLTSAWWMRFRQSTQERRVVTYDEREKTGSVLRVVPSQTAHLERGAQVVAAHEGGNEIYRRPAFVMTGHVLDRESGAPVAGALVKLLDASPSIWDVLDPLALHTAAASVITAEDGGFVLRTYDVGMYRVDVAAPGFAGARSTPFALPADTAPRALRLDLSPAAMPDPWSGCVPDTRLTAKDSVFLEDVTTALGLIDWTQRQGHMSYRVQERVSSFDRLGVQQQDRSAVGVLDAEAVLWPAPPSTGLGYIRPASGSGYDVFAPDLRTLSSEGFLNIHCARIVADDSRPELVGLRLETIADPRRAPGHAVNATFWIRRETRELSAVDIAYPDLPEGLASSATGASMTFLRLPSGKWIITGWTRRVPAAEGGWREISRRVLTAYDGGTAVYRGG